MKNSHIIELIVVILLLVGGLNWGLVGLFDFNLVATLFPKSMIPKVVYSLIGLAAVYRIVMWLKSRAK
jgi:uncharacterized membrane protein YuzA (DUF378 family)